MKQLEVIPPAKHGILVLSSAGDQVAFNPRGDAPTRLLRIPSLEGAGALETPPLALNSGAQLWGRGDPDGRISLVRKNDGAPLVTFPVDSRSAGGTFSAAGTHWAWGHTDGRVTVCAIEEVQRRLAEIGLGWPRSGSAGNNSAHGADSASERPPKFLRGRHGAFPADHVILELIPTL